MPTYDYVCGACGAELEIFQSMTEAPKRKCPECKKPKLTRRIGAGAGILFRGSGFYQTDYRSSSYKQAAEAEQGKSEPAKGEKTATGGEPTSGSGGEGKAEAPKPKPPGSKGSSGAAPKGNTKKTEG
jgi:putative FmdB family regulatory protein